MRSPATLKSGSTTGFVAGNSEKTTSDKQGVPKLWDIKQVTATGAACVGPG